VTAERANKKTSKKLGGYEKICFFAETYEYGSIEKSADWRSEL
jgi:hypothetical protein